MMHNLQIKGFHSLDEIVHEMEKFHGDVSFISGGTDFINSMNKGAQGYDLIIDLSQVWDLNYIAEDSERIRIGSGTTFTSIAESPLIRGKATCLAQAASQVGSLQIRNRATIGGNVATASPAADSMPPLTVLNGEARLIAWGKSGIKEVDERPIDVCGTELAPNELITEITFPVPPKNCRTGFRKLGSRSSVSIAKLNMAMKVLFDPDTRVIKEGKVALGALGEEPLCPDDLRDFLTDQRVNRAFVGSFLDKLVDIVDGAIGERASRPYKMSAVRGLGEDLLVDLFGPSLTGVSSHWDPR